MDTKRILTVNNKLLLHILCGAGVCCSVQAQSPWTLSIRGGSNISFSKLQTSPALPPYVIRPVERTGPMAGIDLEKRINPGLSVRFGFRQSASKLGLIVPGLRMIRRGSFRRFTLGLTANNPIAARWSLQWGGDLSFVPIADNYTQPLTPLLLSVNGMGVADSSLNFRINQRELNRANWGITGRVGLRYIINPRSSISIEAHYLYGLRPTYQQTGDFFRYRRASYQITNTSRGSEAGIWLAYQRAVFGQYVAKEDPRRQVFASVSGLYAPKRDGESYNGFLNVKAGYFFTSRWLAGAEYIQFKSFDKPSKTFRVEGGIGLFSRFYALKKGRINPYVEPFIAAGDGRTEPNYDGIDNYSDPIYLHSATYTGLSVGADLKLNRNLRATTGLRYTHTSQQRNSFWPYVGASINF